MININWRLNGTTTITLVMTAKSCNVNHRYVPCQWLEKIVGRRALQGRATWLVDFHCHWDSHSHVGTNHVTGRGLWPALSADYQHYTHTQTGRHTRRQTRYKQLFPSKSSIVLEYWTLLADNGVISLFGLVFRSVLTSDWDQRSAEKWSHRFVWSQWLAKRLAETKLRAEQSLNPKLINSLVDFACTR